MQKAIVYARISQDRTGAGLGVDRQFTECEEFARDHGLEVVERLSDNDISAYAEERSARSQGIRPRSTKKRRPAYERLLERIRAGQIDVVLVWHTDRLHRAPWELEEYIEASNVHGIQTLTVKAGKLDLATSHGRLVARQLGSLARYESEHKGDRVKAKRRQAALAGEWQGGARPFGWQIHKETDERGIVRNVPVVDEKEAQLVRWAFQAVLEGKPISGIVAHFQRSGVPSARGNGWRHSTVRSLLQKTRNCGIESLHGEEMGPSTFPALVDEGTFRAVQRILKDPVRKSQDDNRVKHLLSGIARCHCGELMLASKSSGKDPHRIYVCSSNRFPATRRRDVTHVARRASELEEHVVRRWPHAIYGRQGSALRLHGPANADDLHQLQRELDDLRAQQDELLDFWARRVVNAKQFETQNVRLSERVQELEERLATKAQEGKDLPDLRPNQVMAYWETLDVLERRALLKQSVEIVCYPTGGKRFNKLEKPWEYVKITPRAAKDGDGRIVYWKPTVEPEYDEGDPASAGLPSDTPPLWPPAEALARFRADAW